MCRIVFKVSVAELNSKLVQCVFLCMPEINFSSLVVSLVVSV